MMNPLSSTYSNNQVVEKKLFFIFYLRNVLYSYAALMRAKKLEMHNCIENFANKSFFLLWYYALDKYMCIYSNSGKYIP